MKGRYEEHRQECLCHKGKKQGSHRGDGESRSS